MEQQKVAVANTEPFSKKLDPLGDGISSLELVRVSGGDIDIVNAARVSHGKFVTSIDERDKKLIRFLIKHQHTSPFEHNQLSFRVKAPIYVTIQWMRHRMHSYNQISYRYVKAAIEFYVPKTWRAQDTVNKQGSVGNFQDKELEALYRKSIEQSYAAYEQLLERGVAREIARGILPYSVYTEFIFTTNLHALMHFLKLRLDPGAQPEIRNYAKGLFELAVPHFPVALQEWGKLHAPQIQDEFTDVFTELTK